MKHLLNSVSFVGVGLFIFGVIYVAVERISPAYPELKSRMEILEQRASEIEVVTLGHSHNVSIDFDAMGVDGFHLWTASADPFETKYWAEYAVPKLPNLKYVLIASSYWVFRRDNTAGAPTVPSYFPEKRRELYAVTNSVRFIKGDFSYFVKGKLAPIVRVDHWKGIVDQLITGAEKTRKSARDGKVDYHPADTVSAEALRKDAEEQVAHDLMLQTAMVADHKNLVQDAFDTFDEMAAYLNKRGVKVIFFILPFYVAYNERTDKPTAEEMRRLMRQLADKHENVVYYDFSTHPSFTEVSEYYFDSTHLNVGGSKVFSQFFREQLENDGYMIDL